MIHQNCLCKCHRMVGAEFCRSCYVFHGISYRTWKNLLEPHPETHPDSLGDKDLVASPEAEIAE